MTTTATDAQLAKDCNFSVLRPCFRAVLVSDPCPAFKLLVVQRDTAATAGKDEHAGGD